MLFWSNLLLICDTCYVKFDSERIYKIKCLKNNLSKIKLIKKENINEDAPLLQFIVLDL